jgi:hypothetical protein
VRRGTGGGFLRLLKMGTMGSSELWAAGQGVRKQGPNMDSSVALPGLYLSCAQGSPVHDRLHVQCTGAAASGLATSSMNR